MVETPTNSTEPDDSCRSGGDLDSLRAEIRRLRATGERVLPAPLADRFGVSSEDVRRCIEDTRTAVPEKEAVAGASPAAFRDLLLADLALVLEVAAARDVAYALQRFWEGREAGASFLAELRVVAEISEEAEARLTEEAEKWIAEAGGDARVALGARGGIDRTIHMELSLVAAPLVGELADAGAGVRAPLPVVPEERYLGFQEIGSGGMGVVYLALDSELNRRVAMKVVRPERRTPDAPSPLELTPPESDTPASGAFRTLIARFLQEAVVTGGLEHPGIVPVYELGQTPKGIPYYTMRFVKGERTLGVAIEAAETLEDRLALLEPFLKVCDTLAYAHSRGVIHRDLKPANVVLGEFGEVVVIDWGLARLKERVDLSQTVWKDRIEEIRRDEGLETMAGGLGTPGYMAPEAILGEPGDLDERSDVYSLGAMLYRLLTGRLPYEFESVPELLGKLLQEDPAPPQEWEPAIPEKLSRICLDALARNRRKRPGSVRELAGTIRHWQRESELDREVEGLLEQARSAWADAEGLDGEGLLRQIDRVLGHANRVLQIRPGELAARDLVGRATQARTGAVALRERLARMSLLRRVAAVGLVLALVAAGGVAMLLDRGRRRAEQAETRTSIALKDVRRERDQKQAALLEVKQARSQAEVERDEKQAALESLDVEHRRAVDLLATAFVLRSEQAEAPAGRFLYAAQAVDSADRADTRGALLSAASQATAPLWRSPYRPSGVFDLAFSPDGETLCLGSGEKEVSLWNPSDGREIARLRGHGNMGVPAVDFSRDGRFVASGGFDNTVRIWDVGTEAEIVRLEGHLSSVKFVEFSEDGERVASASRDGTIRIWDLAGKSQAEELPLGEVHVLALRLLDGGPLFAVKSGDSKLILRDGGGLRWEFEAEGGAEISAAAIERTGRRCALGVADGTVHLWSRSEGYRRGESIPGGAAVTALAFEDGGRALAAGTDQGEVVVWGEDFAEPKILRGTGDSPIRAVAFCPGSSLLAAALIDRTVRLWDTRSGKVLRELRGHSTHVRQVQFTPDGRALVSSGGYDGTLQLRDSRTGRELVCASDLAEVVGAFSCHPDGKRIYYEARVSIGRATGGGVRTRGMLRVLDLASGESEDVADGVYGSVSLTADGRLVAFSVGDGVRVWDLIGNREVAHLRGFTEYVSSVDISPDGGLVVAGSNDNTVRVWSVKGPAEWRVIGKHAGMVSSVAFRPGGKEVVSGSYDGTARIWDIATGKEVRRFSGRDGWVMGMAVSPDGSRIATCGLGETVRLWDVGTGRQLGRFDGHTHRISTVAFSPDGRLLASGAMDNTVRMWDVSGAWGVVRLAGREPDVRGLSFLGKDGPLVLACRDRTLRLVDRSSGMEIRRVPGHEKWISDLALSPDGSMLATVDGAAKVRIFDTTDWSLQATFPGPAMELSSAAWLDGGARLAVAGRGAKTVWIYEFAGGGRENLRVLPTRRSIPLTNRLGVSEMTVSPDGDRLLTVGGMPDDTLEVRDRHTGELLFGCKDLAGEGMISVAVNPAGSLVATGTNRGTIRIWSLEDGTHIARLDGHGSWVEQLAFSPRGRYLASASWDDSVILWDVAGLRAVAHLTGFGDAVWTVAFAPDGRHLAAGSDDGMLRLFDLEVLSWGQGSCLDRARNITGYMLRGFEMVPAPFNRMELPPKER